MAAKKKTVPSVKKEVPIKKVSRYVVIDNAYVPDPNEINPGVFSN